MIQLYRITSLLFLLIPLFATTKSTNQFLIWDFDVQMSEDFCTFEFDIDSIESNELINIEINGNKYGGSFDTSKISYIDIPTYEFDAKNEMKLIFSKYNVSYKFDFISSEFENLTNEEGEIFFSRIVSYSPNLKLKEKRNLSYSVPSYSYLNKSYIDLNNLISFNCDNNFDLSDYSLYLYLDDSIISYPYEKEDNYYKIPINFENIDGTLILSLKDKLYIDGTINKIVYDDLFDLTNQFNLYFLKSAKEGNYYSYFSLESRSSNNKSFIFDFTLCIKKDIQYPSDLFKYL